jgi:hypothetical protein
MTTANDEVNKSCAGETTTNKSCHIMNLDAKLIVGNVFCSGDPERGCGNAEARNGLTGNMFVR